MGHLPDSTFAMSAIVCDEGANESINVIAVILIHLIMPHGACFTKNAVMHSNSSGKLQVLSSSLISTRVSGYSQVILLTVSIGAGNGLKAQAIT